MKMTPTEIRQKSFEKNFRGYDKDEVTAYLNTLAEEFENLLEEKKDLQRKLEQSEKEGAKLKQVEESLFRTLKTAEDTGASIIEEANQAADHILREAHDNAEAMFNDAHSQSDHLIKSAEAKGREIMENLKNDVSTMVSSYETMIQQRELLLKNLKKLSEDINDNISLSQNDFKKVKIQAHAQLVEELNKSNAFSMAKIKELKLEEIPEKEEKVIAEEEPKPEIEKVPTEEIKAEIEAEVEAKTESEAKAEVEKEGETETVTMPESGIIEKPEVPKPSGDFRSLQSKAQEALENFGQKENKSQQSPSTSSEPEKGKTKQEGSFFDQLD